MYHVLTHYVVIISPTKVPRTERVINEQNNQKTTLGVVLPIRYVFNYYYYYYPILNRLSLYYLRISVKRTDISCEKKSTFRLVLPNYFKLHYGKIILKPRRI